MKNKVLNLDSTYRIRFCLLKKLCADIFCPTSYLFTISVLTLHGYFCWAQGAVLWVDAASYINISDALQNFNSVEGIIQGPSLWWHNYVPLGLPLAWNYLSRLPTNMIWPTLAITQHVIAALSLIFIIRKLYCLWPSKMFGISGLLICFFPFYQSLHNAFLTESISSSILLVSLGFALRIIKLETFDLKYTILMSLCIALATQFRSTVAVFCLMISLQILLYTGRLFSKKSIIMIVVCCSGLLFFPALRTLAGGEFIAPRPGPAKLWGALNANPNPSQNVFRKFQTYKWPQEIKPEEILSKGASFDDISKLMAFWISLGATNHEAMSLSEKLGSIIMDDGIFPKIHAAVYGFSGSGLNLQLLLLPANHQVIRGKNGNILYLHNINHYKYLSWLFPNRQTFDSLLEKFFEKKEMSASHHMFAQAWKPYFKDHLNVIYRDPLFLGRITPDIWFMLGIFTYAILLFRIPIVSIMFLSIIFANIYITGNALFPNIRYSYPLMLIFLLSPAFIITARNIKPIKLMNWIKYKIINNFKVKNNKFNLKQQDNYIKYSFNQNT